MAYGVYTVLERRKENNDLLRVARLLNPAPRSLADYVRTEPKARSGQMRFALRLGDRLSECF